MIHTKYHLIVTLRVFSILGEKREIFTGITSVWYLGICSFFQNAMNSRSKGMNSLSLYTALEQFAF